jgi:hypothetical protein
MVILARLKQIIGAVLGMLWVRERGLVYHNFWEARPWPNQELPALMVITNSS